ncbi:MAG: hypothetical protein PHU63_00600 [Candidatus ainarchaeum sp.]|nr:hypothetical protein [Candidatus ainarchaeum sp.]
MLRSSQRAHTIARSSPKLDELPKELFTDQSTILKPEERFQEEAYENMYYKGLITLSLGKSFSERISLSKSEIERFTLLYDTDSQQVRRSTYNGIIPLKREGYPWASTHSRVLRKKYKNNADKMFERLELCDFEGDYTRCGSIELVNIPYKTIDYIEFSSASAIVDKKPHKRSNQFSGDSVYFRDFYLGGKRGIAFAVFDGNSTISREDSAVSALLVSLFKKFFNPNKLPKNDDSILFFLSSFADYAKQSLASLKISSEASLSVGLVYLGNLYYLNIGDCRIYLASFNGDVSVKKVTNDTSTTQFFSSKKKNQSLLNKNIGKIPITEKSLVIACSDGFWSNLPSYSQNGNGSDSGELSIKALLSTSSPKNPKQIAELLYNYSKSNMKLRRTFSYSNSTLNPNPQDIAILCFSV